MLTAEGRNSDGRLHVLATKLFHRSLSQTISVALAGFRDLDDFLSDNLGERVLAVSQSKGYQSAFIGPRHTDHGFRLEYAFPKIR